jgi:hypothetical protein
MSNYLDTLMTNNNVLSDSSFDEPMKYTSIKKKKIISGGNIDNIATGSFPPIYKMTEEEKEKKESNKSKTFSTNKSKSISDIQEILRKRREDSKVFMDLS